MGEYAWDVASQRQQGGDAATMAAPQPPHPQHVAGSQRFQKARAEGSAFRSAIARQLPEIDGYYLARSTGKEGKEQHNEDHME